MQYKTIKEYDDEISSVNNQIKELNDYKTKLNRELTELVKNSDLETRLRVWISSDEEQHWDYICGIKEECPLLRDKIDDLHRYETYYLSELYEEAVSILLNGQAWGCTEKQEQKIRDKDFPALEQCMKAKLKSFKVDW